MPLCTPDPIFLTDRERIRLQALVRQHNTPQQLATRARIILEADAGRGVSETAAALQVGRSLIQRWRRRRRARADQRLEQRLSDVPSLGTPATFTPEQICALIALACETPARGG